MIDPRYKQLHKECIPHPDIMVSYDDMRIVFDVLDRSFAPARHRLRPVYVIE